MADEITGGSELLDRPLKFIGPIGEVVDTAGGLLSFIPRPNRDKIDATGTQQIIERAAMDIQRNFNSGLIDADAAIQALDELALRLQIWAITNGATGAGAQVAGQNLSQIKADILSKRNARLADPLSQGGLAGSPNLQRDRIATLLRNRLAGLDPGNQLDNTPLAGLTSRVPGSERLEDVTARVQNLFPAPQVDSLGARLRARADESQARRQRLGSGVY